MHKWPPFFFFQLTKKVHLLLWDVFIADYLNVIDARGHGVP